MSDKTLPQAMGEVIQPAIERPHAIGGTQRLYRFPNGYGASVVRFQFGSAGSYGADQGLWEMAVIRYDGDDWEIVYDTPVADDVIGWLDEDAIQEKLRQIRDVPVPAPTNPDRFCRHCGATSGLKMLHSGLGYIHRAWECYDGCGGAR